MGEEEINLLKRISPIAWQFVCFGGAFDFSLKNTLNVKDMVAIITKYFNEELSKSK
jgi:CRISPR/Cas system-associated protein Cas10 (large subunit of type III CRISPR-Cas system)